MFKALLAASLAMLACCVAAAWAGQVHPADTESPASAATHGADPLPPLHDLDAAEVRDGRSLLDDVIAEGFVPVSLSASDEVTAAAPPSARLSAEDAALVDPAAKPAVIPLPPALYAGTALLAAAVLWRKRLLRACHA